MDELPLRDNRYDVWKCVECGNVKVIRSVPHEPPHCCGTGMWFQELRIGASYLIAHARDV